MRQAKKWVNNDVGFMLLSKAKFKSTDKYGLHVDKFWFKVDFS